MNNDSGKQLAKLVKSINPITNNLAEFETLEEGLKIYLNLGISKLMIEGDSDIVLNDIRNRSTLNWILNSKLEEIIHLIDKFEDTRIFHIYREGNFKACELANIGVDGVNFLKLDQGI